jgi:hypothetical protein
VKTPFYVPLLDRMNPAIVAILRSPFHWLASAGLMALTITGRRTGRVYTIPVGYHDVGDAIVVLVSGAANRTWWRNFRQPHPAELTLRGAPVHAVGMVLRPEDDEFRRRAEQAFARAAFIPRIFGIEFDPVAGLAPEQLRDLAAYAAVVRFTRDDAADRRPS